MSNLTRQDIIYAIRLLQAALNYLPEELDTEDYDVLRWENEGGVVHVQVVQQILPSEEGV